MPPTPADASSARRVRRRLTSARPRSRRPSREARPARRSTRDSFRVSPSVSCGVGHEPAALAVRRERRVDVGEAPLDRPDEIGILRGDDRADGVEGLPGAVDVRLEVDQVDVRVALLLARHLRLGDLAEELDRAVRDLRRLELDVGHEPLEPLHVPKELVEQAARHPSSCPSPRATARGDGNRSSSPSARPRLARRSRDRDRRSSRRRARSARTAPEPGRTAPSPERCLPPRRRPRTSTCARRGRLSAARGICGSALTAALAAALVSAAFPVTVTVPRSDVVPPGQ